MADWKNYEPDGILLAAPIKVTTILSLQYDADNLTKETLDLRYVFSIPTSVAANFVDSFYESISDEWTPEVEIIPGLPEAPTTYGKTLGFYNITNPGVDHKEYHSPGYQDSIRYYVTDTVTAHWSDSIRKYVLNDLIYHDPSYGLNRILSTAIALHELDAEYSIKGISFNGLTCTYDGIFKELLIEGTLPEDTSVVYKNNMGRNAGVYEATATISGVGYRTLVLTATLTINKATIIGSLNSYSFEYDGTKKSLVFNGDIPSELFVEWTGNGQSLPGVYPVTIHIHGGTNYHDVINSATMTIKVTKKTLEPVKLESFIDYDESWSQTDCHWLRQKFFDFTWTVHSGNFYSKENILLKYGASLSTISFYYKIGKAVTVPANKQISDYYTPISSVEVLGSKLVLDKEIQATLAHGAFRSQTTYHYFLSLNSLKASELKALYSEPYITTYVAAIYTDINGNKIKTTSVQTLPYLDVKLPPYIVNKAEVKKYSSKKFICDWEEAIPQREDSPVDGYRIELLMKQTGTEEFKKVKGLCLDQDEEGNYWIKKDNTFVENTYTEVPTDPEELNNFLAEPSTIVNQAAYTEVDITDPTVTQVYFNPKDFCVKRTDSFKFIVYPYTILSEYDTYDEDGNIIHENLPSALLASAGTESISEDGRTNVIRVKYNNTWTEGLIWVKVNGEWKEATAVYTKAGGSWKEPV